MKKLLLTSGGFSSQQIVDVFKNMVEKNLQELKVLYIPTACRPNSPPAIEFISMWKNVLVRLGIGQENISSYDFEFEMSAEELSTYQAVYVGGGNTFYLLHKLKENGFDKKLAAAVENGLVYVGMSAGSIVAGPTIETAAPFDPNDIGIKDFSGMNLTAHIVVPHYSEKRKEIVKKFQEILPYEIVAVKDTQALAVWGDKKEIVGI